MANTHVSKEAMLERVARFKELKSSAQAFLDSEIPGHERDIYNVIGRGVTEDSNLNPAITAVQDFNVTYVGASPGKGGGAPQPQYG